MGTAAEKEKKQNLTVDYLRVNLTDAEVNEVAKQLGRATQELREVEARKAAITSNLGGEVKLKTAEIDRMSMLITNGYEYRDIQCRWEMDSPKRGQKTLIRLDSETAVKTLMMTDADKQQKLPGVDAEPVTSTAQ